MKYRTAEQPFAIVMTAETEGEARHLEYLHSRMEPKSITWGGSFGVVELALEMSDKRKPKSSGYKPTDAL
jgi:hypothetical protein